MGLIYGFLVLLASIPLGHILKSITEEELKIGKKYFAILCVGSLILALVFLAISFNNQNLKLSIVFSLLFMANVAFISWK